MIGSTDSVGAGGGGGSSVPTFTNHSATSEHYCPDQKCSQVVRC